MLKVFARLTAVRLATDDGQSDAPGREPVDDLGGRGDLELDADSGVLLSEAAERGWESKLIVEHLPAAPITSIGTWDLLGNS
jgi:hypothetical protein